MESVTPLNEKRYNFSELVNQANKASRQIFRTTQDFVMDYGTEGNSFEVRVPVPTDVTMQAIQNVYAEARQAEVSPNQFKLLRLMLGSDGYETFSRIVDYNREHDMPATMIATLLNEVATHFFGKDFGQSFGV